MNKTAEIWKGDFMCGTTLLTDEEAVHFSCAPHCVARVVLSQSEINRMNSECEAGLCDDDTVTVAVN